MNRTFAMSVAMFTPKKLAMKYECKENDSLIEMGRDKSEILISVKGETAKTVIGLKDLNEALILFGVQEAYCEHGIGYSIEDIKPHYFPLSMFTKPIKVSSYNDGNEFVPYDKLFFGSDEDVHKQGVWFLEQIKDGKGRHAVMLLPHFKVLAMRKMMLNVDDLDTEKFIDASISKVYEDTARFNDVTLENDEL